MAVSIAIVCTARCGVVEAWVINLLLLTQANVQSGMKTATTKNRVPQAQMGYHAEYSFHCTNFEVQG